MQGESYFSLTLSNSRTGRASVSEKYILFIAWKELININDTLE
jgi:hypothetical protein